jgi:hypothetical protein
MSITLTEAAVVGVNRVDHRAVRIRSDHCDLMVWVGVVTVHVMTIDGHVGLRRGLVQMK